jgi:hypothetical protein
MGWSFGTCKMELSPPLVLSHSANQATPNGSRHVRSTIGRPLTWLHSTSSRGAPSFRVRIQSYTAVCGLINTYVLVSSPVRERLVIRCMVSAKTKGGQGKVDVCIGIVVV